MRRVKLALGFFVISIVASPNLTAQALPIPDGRRLREIVEENFPEGNLLIGATTGSWGFTNPIGEIMDREFSYVTPENDFKQQVIRNDPNGWNWSRADAWLQHIIDHKQVLRIHGPISPQCSDWAKADMRTGEELSEELDTFMTALCQRYNGVEGIAYLDVVNEIALPDGSWLGPKPGTDSWENPWLRIGLDKDPNHTPLYVSQAFGIANEHAPDLKQILNNHCHPGTAGMEKVKETILYLRDRGYRVDGLGWQAHIDAGWATAANLQHLRDVIDWCKEQDLEFHITEFDAWIYNYQAQSLENQAYTYQSIMDVLVEKVDGMTIGWNAWHITDAAGWQPERKPAVFDDNYQPKLAYYTLQLALETKGDYTTLHEVTFQVRHTETGELLNDYELVFNGEVSDFAFGAGRYILEVRKKHMENLRKGISIYKDTLITLWMNPAHYDVTFHTTDLKSGMNLSTVEVAIDTLVCNSDLAGNASCSLKAGTYDVRFTKPGYKSLSLESQVLSDTTLEIQMEKTHGTVKFRVKNGQVPVNGALIVLQEDTLLTNGLGICSFESLPLNQAYAYSAAKAHNFPVSGEVMLEKDTTIELQLSRSVAHLEFLLDDACLDAKSPQLILGSDTAWFNGEGKLKFYNIPRNQELTYLALSDNYPAFRGTIVVDRDTTIKISLAITGVTKSLFQKDISIFPNPASDFLFIRSSTVLQTFQIVNSLGVVVQRTMPNTHVYQLNVKEIPSGLYWLILTDPDGAREVRSVCIE